MLPIPSEVSIKKFYLTERIDNFILRNNGKFYWGIVIVKEDNLYCCISEFNTPKCDFNINTLINYNAEEYIRQ